jgi:hypothetical protein
MDVKGTLKRALVLTPVLGLTCAVALLVGYGAPAAQPPEPAAAGYLPGLGDMMNVSMQSQHTKLWFAGHADNWALAAYEIKEMRETIANIQVASPQWHGLNVGEMVKVLSSQVDAVEQTVKAKDPVKFVAAYDSLTNTCNVCHLASGRQEIIVIRPLPQGEGTFADQDFTAGQTQP